MMDDDAWQRLHREAAEIESLAPWLSLTSSRDEQGQAHVEVRLVGGFAADPEDLSGSIIREIHRRITEFEVNLE